MEELHAQLSHIGAGTVCEMLAKGMVTGVKLHLDHTTMGQCEACKYGKATHKPIGKDHEPVVITSVMKYTLTCGDC